MLLGASELRVRESLDLKTLIGRGLSLLILAGERALMPHENGQRRAGLAFDQGIGVDDVQLQKLKA